MLAGWPDALLAERPNFGELQDPRVVADLARTAEQAGWDALFVWDHVLHVRREEREIADPWVLLTAAASHDVLAKIMYAHLYPRGGMSGMSGISVMGGGSATAAQLRAAAQLMYYGGDVVEVALAVLIMVTWYRRSGRALQRSATAAMAVNGEVLR